MDNRIIEQFNAHSPFNLEDGSLIVLAQIGSHSHGTYIPSTDPNSIDDIDYMGIVVPPKSYTFGLESCQDKKWQSTVFKYEELDCVFYSFQHYIKLISYKRNPNVLGLLWLNPEMYLESSWEWEEMVRNRSVWSCKNCLETYRGTAKSHFEKMRTGEFQGYMGDKRKRLVEKFGYDCKDAAHAIRLLRMGIEFFKTGKMNVDRTGIDSGALKVIKTGGVPLGVILDEWVYLENWITTEHARSLLPDSPDYKRINEIVEKVMLSVYGLDYWDFGY